MSRPPQLVGQAADLGNVIHGTLEVFVKETIISSVTKATGFDRLIEIYDEQYYKHFTNNKHHAVGKKMLDTWYRRTDFTDRQVLSIESKRRFPLKWNGSAIPFVYIMDRMDRNPNQEIEVVDYKTSTQPMSADTLEHDLQARAYGVAAQVLYPDERRIWVTFDFLRYEPVSVAFTKEENRATARYLRAMYGRILESDGSQEQLNSECRFCIRRSECSTLQRHIKAGGPLKLSNPQEAADQRYELESAKGAIGAMLEDIDAYLLGYCEEQDTLTFHTDEVNVRVTAQKRRHVNAEMVRRVVGADLANKYGNMNVGALEELMKDPTLTSEQKAELKGAVATKFSEPSIKTTKRSAFEEEDS